MCVILSTYCIVPVLYRMAPKTKRRNDGPSFKVGKRPGQGSRLTSQTKYVLHNIKNFFDQEKQQERTFLRNKVHDRVAKATGLSRRTVFNILKSVTPDNTYLTPTKRYERTQIRVDPDSFDRTAIK